MGFGGFIHQPMEKVRQQLTKLSEALKIFLCHFFGSKKVAKQNLTKNQIKYKIK
jgi:hypothetical protein